MSEILGRRVKRLRLVASMTGLGLLLFAFHPPVWLAVTFSTFGTNMASARAACRCLAQAAGPFALLTLALVGITAVARSAASFATSVILAGSALKAPIDLLLTALTWGALVWIGR